MRTAEFPLSIHRQTENRNYGERTLAI